MYYSCLEKGSPSFLNNHSKNLWPVQNNFLKSYDYPNMLKKKAKQSKQVSHMASVNGHQVASALGSQSVGEID